MLGQLGLGPDEEAVYRVMVASGTGELRGLVERLGWTEERARAALDKLAALSLVRPSADGGTPRPVDPELGLTSLLVSQEAEVLERQRQVTANRLAVSRILAEIRARGGEAVTEVRKLRTRDEIHAKMEHLASTCAVGLTGFVPDGGACERRLAESRPLDEKLLERGLRLRYVFLDSARNTRASRDYARWLGERGGLVRTTPRLPSRMLVYDRETAIVPVDPDAADQGALLLHGTGAVAALQTLFDAVWQQARPLGRPAAPGGDALSPTERAVLELLAEGLVDDAIARQLGVSVRTIRRVTADLMQRLGARSRFEAGVLASSRGLLKL